jgi:NADH-quinone oxidoreductase subunit J
MEPIFYISAAIATLATALALGARQAVHALLYFVTALLSLGLNLYVLGNELAAVLLIIVYAGAIMVLFVFVVMLLNPSTTKSPLMGPISYMRNFFGPLFFAVVIFGQFVFVLMTNHSAEFTYNVLTAKEIAAALFTDGWFFVELLSLLLTAALIGAFHIGRRRNT